MLSESLETALHRAESHLLELDAPEGIIARREAGRPAPDDPRRAAALARELLDGQARDGSWDGDLVRTADALLRLHDLVGGTAAANEELVRTAVARAAAWLKERQGAPGRFGDGCSPDLHRDGLCHHFLGGFFAPAPPDITCPPVRLHDGAAIEDDAAARFTASCLALRALLRWGVDRTDIRLHVEGIRRILSLHWDPKNHGYVPPAAGLEALAALLDAPPTPENHAVAERALARVLRSQRADGSWPELDTLHALDVLLLALRRELSGNANGDAIRAALRRGAGLLAAAQPADGAWTRQLPGRRALLAWRVLRATAP